MKAFSLEVERERKVGGRELTPPDIYAFSICNISFKAQSDFSSPLFGYGGGRRLQNSSYLRPWYYATCVLFIISIVP